MGQSHQIRSTSIIHNGARNKMSTDLKERKFIECFKSICPGSCNYCKSRSWNIGNKIYGMVVAPGSKKWFVCSDRKCYLEQGGILTIFKKEEPKPIEVHSGHSTMSSEFGEVICSQCNRVVGFVPGDTKIKCLCIKCVTEMYIK